MTDIILADNLAGQICRALGIQSDTTTRIVIDLPAGEVARVYVEMVGSRDLLDVDWALGGARITTLGQAEDGAEGDTPLVQRLQLEPGDTIVLSYPGTVPHPERERIIESIKRLYPDHRAIVLDHGLTISTVRSE